MPADPRLANRDDLDAVEEIVQTAYSKYVSRIGREPGPMLDDYGALIDEGRVYVVEHDGAVKGILVLVPEADGILLDNVAVAPAAQALGLGRKMLQFAERMAIERGYGRIRLY